MSNAPEYLPTKQARMLWVGCVLLMYIAVFSLATANRVFLPMIGNYLTAVLCIAGTVYAAWLCHVRVGMPKLLVSFVLIAADILLWFLSDRPIHSPILTAVLLVAFLAAPVFLGILTTRVTGRWKFGPLLLLIVTPLSFSWLFFRDYFSYMPGLDLAVGAFFSIGLVGLLGPCAIRILQLVIILVTSLVVKRRMSAPRTQVWQHPEGRPNPRTTAIVVGLVVVLTLLVPPWVTYESSVVGIYHTIRSSSPPDLQRSSSCSAERVLVGWHLAFFPPEDARIAEDWILAEWLALLVVIVSARLLGRGRHCEAARENPPSCAEQPDRTRLR